MLRKIVVHRRSVPGNYFVKIEDGSGYRRKRGHLRGILRLVERSLTDSKELARRIGLRQEAL